MSTVPEFEQHIHYEMACGNRIAVSCALEAELELRRFGFPCSQRLIDDCTFWLSQNYREAA